MGLIVLIVAFVLGLLSAIVYLHVGLVTGDAYLVCFALTWIVEFVLGLCLIGYGATAEYAPTVLQRIPRVLAAIVGAVLIVIVVIHLPAIINGPCQPPDLVHTCINT